jgi:RHS repeat-associated protein
LAGKELDKDGVGTDLADAGTNTVTGVQLSYFGGRYLDHMVGKWISTDPAGQYFDKYNYCGDNSINGIDPNGKNGIGVSVSVGAAFGISTSASIALVFNTDALIAGKFQDFAYVQTTLQKGATISGAGYGADATVNYVATNESPVAGYLSGTETDVTVPLYEGVVGTWSMITDATTGQQTSSYGAGLGAEAAVTQSTVQTNTINISAPVADFFSFFAYEFANFFNPSKF